MRFVIMFIWIMVCFIGTNGQQIGDPQDIKNLTIYGFLSDHSLYEEITKRSIKNQAMYWVTINYERFPPGSIVFDLYDVFTNKTGTTRGHLNKGIRYYLVVRTKHGRRLRIYVDNHGNFELGNSGKLGNLKKEDSDAIKALFPEKGYD